jgi:hypothetical protein
MDLPSDQQSCMSQLTPSTYKLSNFSISAWEYEAPTTSPGSRVGFGGDTSLRPSEERFFQKGDADLSDPSQRIVPK